MEVFLIEMINELTNKHLDTMIEKVEIIVMPDEYIKLSYNSQVEKWIELDGSNTIFLRVIYGNHRPITDINFYRVKH